MKPLLVHLLPVTTANDAPVWLLYSAKRSAPHTSRLQTNFSNDDRAWLVQLRAWQIAGARETPDRNVAILINSITEDARPRPVLLCDECACGIPCAQWDFGQLARHDLIPRQPPIQAPPPPDFVEEEVQWDEIFSRAEQFVEDKFREVLGRKPAEGMTARQAAVVLAVQWPCTRPEIVSAFRRAAKAAHPDLGGSHAAMTRINLAREVLERAVVERGQ